MVMEVVATAGAIRRAKLQSNCYHHHPTFYRPDDAYSCHPTNSVKALKGELLKIVQFDLI